MERGLVYRIILVALMVVVAVLSLVPTVYYDYDKGESNLPGWWKKIPLLPQESLNLGLDLRGGMDLVISVDVEQAVLKDLQHYAELMRQAFLDENIAYESLIVDKEETLIRLVFADQESRKNGEEYLRKDFPVLVLREGKGELEQAFTLRDRQMAETRKNTVEQVRNIIRRRIDSFGLREPEIAIQGRNRIRLQLPGAENPERIKENIIRTAKLDFLLVKARGESKKTIDEEGGAAPPGMVLASWEHPTRPGEKIECYMPPESGLAEGAIPANNRLAIGASEVQEGIEREICYLLSEEGAVSGADLTDARPTFSSERLGGEAVVSFTLNMKGARQFKKLTGEHVGEQIAIVLEGKVESAPVVQSPIFNRGQITGSFTPEEAQELSNVLRSGALLVDISIEEERTVGASLGADSIRSGAIAIICGAGLVVIFMVLYYSSAGLIADMALLLNILFIMAALSLMGATLTLPGLAGIVLTVGMAVDANVLIFERVREELRTGKTPQASIEAGYAKALWTILDANITTLIAAMVLYQWGTGPIKGFAVTLALGIVSSLFTAIVVTRVVYDVMFKARRRGNLNIGVKLADAYQTKK